MGIQEGCNASIDRQFGTIARCNQFDFTLTFEQSIFGIGITSIFLLIYPVRFYQLHRLPNRVNFSLTYVTKLSFAGISVAIQAATLAIWTRNAFTGVAIASAALGCINSLAILSLTILEHTRTIRPSSVISLYLVISIVTDAVQLRTLLIRHYVPAIAGLMIANMVGKALLLLVESSSKVPYLKEKEIYSPEEITGIIGRSVFWWLNPLLLRGNRKVLSPSDLSALDRDLYSETLKIRMSHTWERQKSDKYRLLRAVFVCLRWDTFRIAVPRASMIAFSYAQPSLISATLNYLQTPSEERDKNFAYGLVGAAALIYFGLAIATAQYGLRSSRLITAARGALVSLTYSKTLSIQSEFKDSAPITLMSTDVDQVAAGISATLDLPALLIQVIIGMVLLWRELGGVAVAPVLLVVICTVIQTWISRYLGPKQVAWVQAVQQRVGIVSTVLRSMKSVKLSGLTDSMVDLLQEERKRELHFAQKFRWMIILTTSISNIPNIFSALVVFAAYAIESRIKGTPPLSTTKAFTSLSIVILLNTPVAMLLNSFPSAIAAMGCVNRIQAFLVSEDFEDPRTKLSSAENHEKDKLAYQDALIYASSLALKLDTNATRVSVISFVIEHATITIILGPVGSGKSTLLKAILGGVEIEKGELMVKNVPIAYCNQTPWLQNGTIRDNIVGFNSFDDDLYQKCLWICSLNHDIAQMPQRDLSETGSQGLSLSGGQKHRIALARALYSRCPLLILDDFIGSLDQNTRSQIARRLFAQNGFARQYGLTVILATHDETFVTSADQLLVLDTNGATAYQGPPGEWNGFPEIVALKDNSKDEPDSPQSQSTLSNDRTAKHTKIDVEEVSPQSDSKRQKGEFSTWIYYAQAVGLIPLVCFATCIVLAAVGVNFPKLLLKWSTEGHYPVGKFVGFYFAMVFITWLCQIAMIAQMMIVIATKSAVNLHKILVDATMHAPMSFFGTTDTSLLLNRFSQDMTMVDMGLPASIFALILAVSLCLVDLAFVCIGTRYMASTIPVVLLAVYCIQKFYLRTSRQMRLLDLESKTPLYKHFTETLEGILTIRAYGWQQEFESVNYKVLDESQKPAYLLACIQRWLNLVLDFTTAMMGTGVVAIALLVPQSSNAGSLGIALTSILSFNNSLQGVISAYTGAETMLGSVTRTKSFEEETPREDADENTPLLPGAEWPRGQVNVSDLSVQYRDNALALQGVSFHVDVGQKLGVAGRTGSGKSTVISSLLRLIEPVHGTISIDGHDITTIPHRIVRGHLICLPQDPFLLPKSIRYNLDPMGLSSNDQILLDVLKTVGMQPLVEKRGGLDADLTPSSLSHGEQQLFILARSILRRRAFPGRRSILVLDEATSNVDVATETRMLDIIREEFKSHTLIMIAHKLDLLRDSDAVVVLHNGEVIKSGTTEDIL